MCVSVQSKYRDKGIYDHVVYISVNARESIAACLSIGMLCCVSRLRLRKQLRALLWLDVSLSFVLE